MRNDPEWQKISASLRKGELYLKMTPEAALDLSLRIRTARVEELEDLQTLLREEAQLSREKGYRAACFIFDTPTASRDIAALEKIPNPGGRLPEFIRALRGGLEGDPELDWIARIQPQFPTFQPDLVKPEDILGLMWGLGNNTNPND